MPRNESQDITVFIATRDSVCSECQTDLGRRAWITLTREEGAICLECADLDHLVFLPAGDAALTRRSKKHSQLWAVVLKWSRARKRYERQGLLVEEAALDAAEAECLADAELRERRRQRNALRREELDSQFVKQFADRILALYPSCPESRAQAIAQHACLKHSGRVGRSAAAKQLDAQAIRLAVIAHIRHTETDYDLLLMSGYERSDARQSVATQVDRALATWEAAPG